MVRGLRAPPGRVFWCGGGAFFGVLGMPFLDLVFFESESNVRHRPCPWFGAFGHLLAGCSGVVGARFLASWGCHFWTLFSSNQKATLDTGHVHGSGPSGTSWQGVLVWWGHVFWHLGDAISGPCFLSKAMSRGSVWRRRAFCFHCFATQRSQEQVLPFVFLCLTWIRPLSSFGQTCAPHFGQLWLYMLGGMTFPSLTLKRSPQTRRWSRTILSRANPLDLGVGGRGR